MAFDRVKLSDAVRAACPAAIGVSVGEASDKATWATQFAEGYAPSAAELTAAAGAITAFDPTAAANVESDANTAVSAAANDPAFRALVRVFSEYTQSPRALTVAQIVARLKALANGG